MKIGKNILLAFTTIGIIGCCGDTESQQLANDEYDRVYMANCVFKTCDHNHDGFITSEDVTKVGSTLYKEEGERALANLGENIDKERFIEGYQIPPNNIGGEVIGNIKYKSVGDKQLMMDLYMPENRSGADVPVVMFVHGGGFWVGHKYIIRNDINPPTVKCLLANGIAVASINYRLLDRETTFIKDCLVDGKDALAFLNKNADKYGLDRENMFVWGQSAGAHVALLAGLSDPQDLPGDADLVASRVQPRAIVSWYGAGMVDVYEDMFENKRFSLSEDISVLEQEVASIVSLNYIDDQDPPVLNLIGDKDMQLLIDSSYVLQDHLTKGGVSNELIIVKNAGHSWSGVDLEPNIEQIAEITTKYIVDHIVK